MERERHINTCCFFAADLEMYFYFYFLNCKLLMWVALERRKNFFSFFSVSIFSIETNQPTAMMRMNPAAGQE
jgi:hypothetical protein